MIKKNIPVRQAAEENHLFLWEVANLMGISYSNFMQKMRQEWTEEEQREVIRIIENYKREGSSHD